MKPYSSKYFKKDIIFSTENVIEKFNLSVNMIDESSLYAANSKAGIWFYYEGHNFQFMFVDIKTDLKYHFSEMFKIRNIVDKYPDYKMNDDSLGRFKERENFQSDIFYYKDICFAKMLSEIIEEYFVNEFF